MTGRQCERCRGTVPFRTHRQRDDKGLMVCEECAKMKTPNWPVVSSLTPEQQREFQKRAAEALRSITRTAADVTLTCPRCKGEGDTANGVECDLCGGTGLVDQKTLREGSRKVAVGSVAEPLSEVQQACPHTTSTMVQPSRAGIDLYQCERCKAFQFYDPNEGEMTDFVSHTSNWAWINGPDPRKYLALIPRSGGITGSRKVAAAEPWPAERAEEDRREKWWSAPYERTTCPICGDEAGIAFSSDKTRVTLVHMDDDGLNSHSKAAITQLIQSGKVATRKVAHDSGDNALIHHCPFCGSGAVTGGSDGSVDCDYCHSVFTVQVQPAHPNMPQTIDGQPLAPPGMPAGEETELSAPVDPAVDEDPTGAPADALGDAEASPEEQAGQATPEQDNDPVPPQFKKGSKFFTTDGEVLDLDRYLRRLALDHADDRLAVLAKVRQENG